MKLKYISKLILIFLPVVFIFSYNKAEAETYYCGGSNCYITIETDKPDYIIGETVNVYINGNIPDSGASNQGGGGGGSNEDGGDSGGSVQPNPVDFLADNANRFVIYQGPAAPDYGFIIPNNSELGLYQVESSISVLGVSGIFTYVYTTFNVLPNTNTPPQIFVK